MAALLQAAETAKGDATKEIARLADLLQAAQAETAKLQTQVTGPGPGGNRLGAGDRLAAGRSRPADPAAGERPARSRRRARSRREQLTAELSSTRDERGSLQAELGAAAEAARVDADRERGAPGAHHRARQAGRCGARPGERARAPGRRAGGSARGAAARPDDRAGASWPSCSRRASGCCRSSLRCAIARPSSTPSWPASRSARPSRSASWSSAMSASRSCCAAPGAPRRRSRPSRRSRARR